VSNEQTTESDVQRREISEKRKGARARFNTMLHEYFKTRATQNVTLVPVWSAQLDVTPQYVRTQCNELKVTGVLGAGDLEALATEDLVDFLEHWLEVKRGELAPTEPARDPQGIALAASVRAGDIAQAVSTATAAKSRGGKKVTGAEWGDIESKCAEGEREMRTAKLAARAARKAGA
jgi:hypothetical protein